MFIAKNKAPIGLTTFDRRRTNSVNVAEAKLSLHLYPSAEADGNFFKTLI